MPSAITQVSKATPVPLHRCRFPSYTPAPITTLALTPPSFNTSTLNFGIEAAERGCLAVGKNNGDVELFCWGGERGWISWRTLPSSFPPAPHSSTKKPIPLLSHLLFTHQTTLSASDMDLYSNDLAGAQLELERLGRDGCRLFGVGGSGSELVEWEWGAGGGKEVGRVKSTLPTLPPIFSLAASRTASHLAIGCEDSTIRILNIMDGELELINRIDLTGAGKVRALSLVWAYPVLEPVSETEMDLDENTLPLHFSTPHSPYLIAGLSSSSLLHLTAPGPSTPSSPWVPLHRMTLDKLKSEQTVVWCLGILADGTIMSGDSMGNVKIWDGKSGTQGQSFKGSGVDVLCLAVGSDGTSFFTSGIDQKTTEYRLVTVSSSSSSATKNLRRWIQSSARRLHSHDVRAMVVSPPYFPALPTVPAGTSFSAEQRTLQSQVPILTSGGLDLSLILVSIATPSFLALHPEASTSSAAFGLNSSAASYIPNSNFSELIQNRNPVSDTPSLEYETTVHRRCAYVPQRSRPISVSRGGRLIVVRRERGVGIWRVAQVNKAHKRRGERDVEMEGDGEVVGGEEGWEKLLEMTLKLQTNLISSALSDDGKWLAVSDLYETKLFKLTSKNGHLTPRRQKSFSTLLSSSLPPSLGTGSSSLLFTPDSSRLILATSFGGTIAVVELNEEEGEAGIAVVKVFAGGETSNGAREIRGLGKRVNGDVSMHGAADDESNNSNSDAEDDDEDEETSVPAQGFSGSAASTMIACMCVSSDGKWLASTDLERKVSVFSLVTLSNYTTLPTPSHVPTSLCFVPSHSSPTPILILALPKNALSLFDIKHKRFITWAQGLAKDECNSMMRIREPNLGIEFAALASSSQVHEDMEEQELGTMVVWGANWVSKIDLQLLKDTSSASQTTTNSAAAKKRSHAATTAATSTDLTPVVEVRTTRRYQPLVFFGFIKASHGGAGVEGIVVEKTWFDLVKELPEAWIKSGTFGT